jgi:hypothetical protein
MAKILRHETTLGARRRALDRGLRSLPLQRLALYGILLALLALLWLWPSPSPLPRRALTARAAATLLLAALAVGWEWHLREAAAEAVNLRAGERGEQALAARFADQLADDHLILNDLSFKIAHERFQIDHLILAPSGIWVVESKYWSGTLSGDASDHTWLQSRPHRPSVRVKSPVFQVRRQRDMFISLFNTGLPEDHIHALAVFTHPRVRLEISRNRNQALLVKDAIRLLNDACFDPPVWPPEAMQSLADRVLASQK